MSYIGSLQSHKANPQNAAVPLGLSIACMLSGMYLVLSLRRYENLRFSATQAREPVSDIFSQARKMRHHRLKGHVE